MLLKFKDKEFILESITSNYSNDIARMNALYNDSLYAPYIACVRNEATCKYIGGMNDLNHLQYLVDYATFIDQNNNEWILHKAIITQMSCWGSYDSVDVSFSFESATMSPRYQLGFFNN